MIRIAISLFACTSLVWAGKFNVYQQAEVISSPRPSTVPANLLFAFVTDQAGFDTEITISNTSQDTSGSTPQSGACTLYFYGANAPAARVSSIIPAGKQIVFNLSSGGGGIAPTWNFQGYVIASCNFRLARGLAKVFAPGVLGYSQDAQIMTTPRGTAAPQYLLFPYVTSRSGYDTGLGIANTSADPFGTAPTSGSCTLSFYGTGAPAPVVTPNIAAGTVYVTLASNIAPNFSGYAIAACGFYGAAGTGFMSDLGVHNLMLPIIPELLTTPRSTAPRPLLFTSLSNQNGLDTGIVIANTSSDPLGTAPTSGSCTINYYGSNAPAQGLIGSIPAGTVITIPLSSTAPGFEGYVVVSCNFAHTRGWAFTTPLGATSEGDAQSAEVIITPRSTAQTAVLFSGANNWNGADTQIIVANTSADPTGTSPVAGVCTISYFGDSPGTTPLPQTSAVIPAGGRLSFSLSQGNALQNIAATPGFHGTVIADCGFPLARGLANITGTRGGLPNSAQPDFNADGHEDVIWQDPATGLAQVWFLGGAQGTTVVGAVNLTASNTWRVVGVGDFNGDGHPDAVWQDPVSGAAQVWYLGGSQGNVVTSAAVLSTGNAWRIVSVADFNGDGRPDLIWQDPVTGLAQIWIMSGTNVVSAVNLTASNTWRIIGTGDFNGDGSPDVIWQDPATGTTQIWYLGGAQGNVVVNAVNLTGANAWRLAGVGDFSGDGRPDVIWQDPVSGTSQVWFLGGTQGTTLTGAAPLSGPNTWRIAAPR